MPMLRDQLIGEMRGRTQPACIACLSTALKTNFDGMMEVSRDALVRKAYDRTYGACPGCHSPGVLLHPYK